MPFGPLLAVIGLVGGFVHGIKRDEGLPMAILKAVGGCMAGFLLGVVLSFAIFYNSDL
jgi:hypothetical protein